tara:strand:- start:17 stop:871 length:855 start_codon:yes stop_codon:yes gene_type:complete
MLTKNKMKSLNGNNIDILKIEKITREIRGKVLDLTYQAKCAHLASALSCIDILAILYWKILKIDSKNINDPERDRFILSKGHAAMALYSILNKKGILSSKILDTFGKNGTTLAEHPDPRTPGVEVATGSLGHGFQFGIGMALAAKIMNMKYKVVALMSDGECNEGSVWEGAMFAPVHKLDNLIAIIDFNKWQATGRSTEIMSIQPLAKKWESFGWKTYEINGHDLEEIYNTFLEANKSKNSPVAIIANTVKGKGISFMEDDNNWHYRIPNEEEVKKAKKELGLI